LPCLTAENLRSKHLSFGGLNLADISAAVIFNNQSEVLLQLRDVKSGIRSPGLWSLPGGSREVGESSTSAVIREVYEETNLIIDNPCYFLSLRDIFEGVPFVDVDFFTVKISQPFNLEVNEGVELKFVALTDLINYDKNIYLDFVISYANLFVNFVMTADN
jgi:8-oxo-dGTP pyrophosphatase MutT (NUDIX family)